MTAKFLFCYACANPVVMVVYCLERQSTTRMNTQYLFLLLCFSTRRISGPRPGCPARRPQSHIPAEGCGIWGQFLTSFVPLLISPHSRRRRAITSVLPRPSPPTSGPDLLLTDTSPPDLRFYPIHFLGCCVNPSGGTGVSWDSPPEFFMARTKNCGPKRPEVSSRGKIAISLLFPLASDQKSD